MAEKFRLVITGADEDVPRLITAYGRACGGELTLVYRPREGEALLVHQLAKQPAKVWRTEVGAPPIRPVEEVAPAEASQLLKRIKAGPPPRGPALLKGVWNGWLICNDSGVGILLERRLTSYGTLQIVGVGNRWKATFARAERWFAPAKAKEIERAGLGDALKAGFAEVQGLVSEACTVRDTHRRGALDPGYAAKHPPKPAREKKDPTERYQPEKKPRGGKKEVAAPAPKKAADKAPSCGGSCNHGAKDPFHAVRETPAGWEVIDSKGVVVARFGANEKRQAEAHASALRQGKSPPAKKAPAKKAPEIDPKKDAMLMDLFSAGIKNAAVELGLA